MRRSTLVATLLAVVSGVCAVPAAAGASEHRDITFPVVGPVHYSDDFGDCRAGCARRHQGNDIIGSKMLPLVAAVNGTITDVRADSRGSHGNMLSIRDDDGWTVTYMHINNDTPGTDDGANPREYAFAPGIVEGVRVTAGQVVAYMGDSGNAEGSTAHLHFELHRPDGRAIDPYTSLRLAQERQGGGLCALPSNPAPTPDPANRGYWAVDASGAVFTFGAAPYLGGVNRPAGETPIVGIAATASGAGYWIVDERGAVATFGDAVDHGSLANITLNAPVVGISATRSGNGYWLVTRDGGVFAFGDATFRGSAPATLNAPIVAMAPTHTGHGYWLVGADGGVFAFGDAQFLGSTGGTDLGAFVVGIAPSPTSNGYWLLTHDGGVFSFGDAAFLGSVPGFGLCQLPVASALVASATGYGYWVLTAAGGVVAFGDAVHHGDPGAIGVHAVALAAIPAQ